MRRRPSSANRLQIADGHANPIETWCGNEAVVVEIQSIRSGLDTSVDASGQALGASDLAVEQAKARSKELFRSQRPPAVFDHGCDLLGPGPVNAKNGAVADFADLLEIATAEPAFREIDQDDSA